MSSFPTRRWPALAIAGLLALACAVTVAGAVPTFVDDQVVPRDTVTEFVTVRELPSGSSAKVGELHPGDSATYIGSVPYYYEVRLADGTPGYVIKSWTHIVPGDPAPTPAAPSTGPTYTLHAIDVGTGLAVLVQGQDFAVLYDGGSNDDRKLGDNNRLSAYLTLAVPTLTRIDHLILSHPHRDHVELMGDIFDDYEVGTVWDSGAINHTAGYKRFIEKVAAEPGVTYRNAVNGSGTFTITVKDMSKDIAHGPLIDTDETVSLGDSASMRFLHADGTHHSSHNENTLVMSMDLGDVRVLFMGDAEAGSRDGWLTGTPEPSSIEAALMACCPSEIDSDVLIVGHHGSKTSSRTAFLDVVTAD
jgi:beta-lactamase superfamily II metal-dependent hydrolase